MMGYTIYFAKEPDKEISGSTARLHRSVPPADAIHTAS